MKKSQCYFCGSTKIRVQKIGIAFGMGGDDYDFCYQCLKNMTADQFWRKLAKLLGYRYPLKLINEDE